MHQVSFELNNAKFALQFGNHTLAIASLTWALKFAQELRSDVPRNRCLRAYIAQALEALQ